MGQRLKTASAGCRHQGGATSADTLAPLTING